MNSQLLLSETKPGITHVHEAKMERGTQPGVEVWGGTKLRDHRVGLGAVQWVTGDWRKLEGEAQHTVEEPVLVLRWSC